MQHFPIFLDTDGMHIVLSGGGDAALAKLRLLMKSEAHIHVYAANPCPAIVNLANGVSLSLIRRPLVGLDLAGASLVYAANDDAPEDARVAGLARAANVPVNIVDNLAGSDFITPAIVDRDPVTIAIGTEGAAPVLARAIKRDLEERLPAHLGTLARIGKLARRAVDILPTGRVRRDFWQKYYFETGPRALSEQGKPGASAAIGSLIEEFSHREATGHVDITTAAFDDPDLLTMQVRRTLDRADVVIHDSGVSDAILELARREAHILSTADQSARDTGRLMVEMAQKGARVFRIFTPGYAGDFRPADEMAPLQRAGISHAVLPGILYAADPNATPAIGVAAFGVLAKTTPANTPSKIKERA